MTKNIMLIIPLLLLSILIAYQGNSSETVAENILTVMFTHHYKDYKNVDDYNDLMAIDIKTKNKVRNFLTTERFDLMSKYGVMIQMESLVNHYKFNSSIDSINIVIYDSEDPNIQTASYDIVLKLDFQESSHEPMYIDLSDSMTLLKKGTKWQVDYIAVNRFFYQSLEGQLRESKFE